MEYLSIDNQDYAAGLWWQTSELNKSSAIIKEARHFIKGINEDVDQALTYNCFVHQSSQSNNNQDQLTASLVGYGNDLNIIKKNGKIDRPINSLALSVLMASKSKSFLHKYSFNDGVWVIAVLNGVIHPDGDYFGDFIGAQELFDVLLKLFDSSGNIVECDDPDESMAIVSELMTQVSQKKPVLNSVQAPKRGKLYFAIGTIIVLITGSFYFYNAHHANQVELERQARLLAAKQAMLMELSKKDRLSQDFPSPWLDTPKVGVMLEHCRSVMNNRTIIEAGWKIHKWACNKENVRISWKKTDSTIYKNMPTGAVFKPKKPNIVFTTDPYEIPFIKRTDFQLINIGVAAGKIYDIAKNNSIGVSISWGGEISYPIPDSNPDEKPKLKIAPFGTFEYTFNKLPTFPSKGLIAKLDAIPGSTIKIIIIEDNKWKLKGEIYAKL